MQNIQKLPQQFKRIGTGTESPSGGVWRSSLVTTSHSQNKRNSIVSIKPKPNHFIDVVFTGAVAESDVDWVAAEFDRWLKNHAISANVIAYST